MICGRSSVAHKSKFGSHRSTRRHHGGSDGFFGLDVENMNSRAQITAALTVLVPVALGAILVLSFVPQMFWLVFVFGWMVFPSVGLLVKGLAGLSATTPEHRIVPASAGSRERELLEALRERGELTPTRAAMETSLSVAEAEKMLKDLAAGGHLEVRTRGVELSYALWTAPERRYLEARTSNGEKGEV
jgi:hypothetical protein